MQWFIPVLLILLFTLPAQAQSYLSKSACYLSAGPITRCLGTLSLTNGSGLPISTGVSGLGTGVATFLATPSSANLDTAVTDDTGSGALVFGTSPTIATPDISGQVDFLGDGTDTTLSLYEGATERWQAEATGSNNGMQFQYVPTAVIPMAFNASGGVQIGAAASIPGLFTTGSAASANSCTTLCLGADTTWGFDTDSGACLAAWNGTTAAIITCADATGGVPRLCLCAGANP